jgi:hypothetical protein
MRQHILYTLLCSVLISCCTFHSPAFADSVQTQTNRTIRMAVDLTDGSHVVGTPDNIVSITLETSYTTMDIPLERISRIKISSSGTSASFELHNGDSLTGRMNLETVDLTAIFGKVSIPTPAITIIDISVDRGSIDRGILLHYSFDNDDATKTRDTSGHDRHGSLHNAYEYVDGVRGKALRVTGKNSTFGSSGGHIILPALDLSLLKEFTLSLWVKDETIPNPHGESYIFFGNDTDGCVSIGDYYQTLRFTVGKSSITTALDKNDETRFVHCGLTFKRGVMKAYKNGKLLGEKNTTLEQLGSDNALARHWWYYSGSKRTSTRFTGAFDEVRIYSRALSPSNIDQLYLQHKAKEQEPKD